MENSKNPSINPADLFEYLSRLGLHAITIEHPPLRTVEEAKALRGDIAGAHTKNLFLKDKKGRFFLIVTGENARLDLKQVAAAIGASGKLSFGPADALAELWGVQPGAVTPFGAINDKDGRVQVILDKALMEEEIWNHHPLVNTMTTSIRRDDLIRFLEATRHPPKVVALSELQ